jgi:hypothetical protein
MQDISRFIISWPGTLLFVWGSDAMQKVRNLSAQHCPAYGIVQAMPKHECIALVFLDRAMFPQQQPPQDGATTLRLYGGKPPCLLLDVSLLDLAALAWERRHALRSYSVYIPQTCPLSRWVTPIVAGPLCEQLPPEPWFEWQLPEEQNDDQELPLLAWCTTQECLLDADPEIRCDQCGAAFCSEDCKFKVGHLCL